MKKIADISTPLADSMRDGFISFYKERGHAEAPNVSLVPNVDSTLLFTNSGMFPLVPYLSGAKHPLGSRLANFQRCIRTAEKDIAEIGDWKHTTMFEMMGNWSLGDYFKNEQIPWVLDLYVNIFGLDPKSIYVSVFAGDTDAPEDREAIDLWKAEFAKYGIENAEEADVMFRKVEADREEAYDKETGEAKPDWTFEDNPNVRIFKYGKKENWWQRGDAVGELGGPDSEMFYFTGAEHDSKVFGPCHPNTDSPAFLEIGNNVFMQYKLNQQLKWEPLAQKNIDFGGGFVRVLLAKQRVKDVFETEIFTPIIAKLEELSGKKYRNENGEDNEYTRYFRIVADHVFGSTFIIFDGIYPANKDQGYILRGFIRRAVRMARYLGLEQGFLPQIAEIVIGMYQRHYEGLGDSVDKVCEVLGAEEVKFARTLQNGLKELQRMKEKYEREGKKISGDEIFYVYETYGFPLELSLEELNLSEEDQKQAKVTFKEKLELHRSASRAGAEQKFTGGLADKSLETTRLHTTHHLLLRSLQTVVNPEIHQKGSNITAERLRIDFNSADKLSPEQIADVELIVQEHIDNENLRVLRVELPIKQAEELGAEHEFGQKYGNLVTVYLIGEFPADIESVLENLSPEEKVAKINAFEIFSKEFCGGPHVKDMNEIRAGGKFKILKEENIGSGTRRIKATLVP